MENLGRVADGDKEDSGKATVRQHHLCSMINERRAGCLCCFTIHEKELAHNVQYDCPSKGNQIIL